MSPGWTGRRLPPLTTQRVRRRRISARHTRLLVAAEGLTERYGLLPDDIPPGFYGPGIFALDLVLSDGSGVIFRPEPALRHLLVLLQFPARPGEPHLAALARLLDALLVPEHLSQSLRDVSRRRHTLRALTSLPALPGILQELPSARESAPSGDTPFTRWPGLGRVTALSPDVDTFTIAAYGRLPVGLAGLGCGCPSEILLEVPVRVRVIPPGDNPFGGAAPQFELDMGALRRLGISEQPGGSPRLDSPAAVLNLVEALLAQHAARLGDVLSLGLHFERSRWPGTLPPGPVAVIPVERLRHLSPAQRLLLAPGACIGLYWLALAEAGGSAAANAPAGRPAPATGPLDLDSLLDEFFTPNSQSPLGGLAAALADTPMPVHPPGPVATLLNVPVGGLLLDGRAAFLAQAPDDSAPVAVVADGAEPPALADRRIPAPADRPVLVSESSVSGRRLVADLLDPGGSAPAPSLVGTPCHRCGQLRQALAAPSEGSSPARSALGPVLGLLTQAKALSDVRLSPGIWKDAPQGELDCHLCQRYWHLEDGAATRAAEAGAGSRPWPDRNQRPGDRVPTPPSAGGHSEHEFPFLPRENDSEEDIFLSQEVSAGAHPSQKLASQGGPPSRVGDSPGPTDSTAPLQVANFPAITCGCGRRYHRACLLEMSTGRPTARAHSRDPFSLDLVPNDELSDRDRIRVECPRCFEALALGASDGCHRSAAL